ncbi:MAG TPA: oligosaccharide flippase family protein [Polyangiales bacterium]
MSKASGPSEGHSSIRRGFLWLGAASVVARVLDTSSVLVVMWFVSREQIGLATLAWSVAVFLEAMNGLGLNAALLQTKDITDERLTAAFWYIMGIATVVITLVCASAGLLAGWYGEPLLGPMLMVAVTKLWFVGAALIPLNQLNRATQFERIAAVSTVATLCSGLLTCALAVLGFQAWSLVIGQASHGLFTCIGANLAHPFRPRGAPRFELIRGEIKFGIKAASASIIYNFYRNADYYLIGRLLGAGAVGVYRVAFDVAMQPTIAVLTVVNRSALPVYARLSEDLSALRSAFLWTLKSLGLLLAPVTAVLVFYADDLLRWVNKGQWLDAAPMVRWLALAAFLRSIAQTFPQLFYALKRPSLALFDSLLTMMLLIGLLFLMLLVWGPTLGPLPATWAWAALAPISFIVLSAITRSLIPVSAGDLARSLGPALGGMAIMSAVALPYAWLVRPHMSPWLAAPLGVTLVLGSFAAYVRGVLGIRLSNLSARTPV